MAASSLYHCAYKSGKPCMCVSLGCILAQLLMSHEELLSLLEGLADGVALVDSLDRGSSDILDGCYGQGAMLQHKLGHLTVPP